MHFRHIYGPVLSRRLGRSLGVDIIPFKTCSYDCVYCLLGRTNTHTTQVREYIPKEEILRELELKLACDTPDAISFAGSGEPTLNSALGEIIDGIKEMTDVPVVVFTNSSLLWKPEVRRNLMRADIISPSMDAVLPSSLQAVNRLAPGLDPDTICQGLRTFCSEYRGRIWLEILFAAGFNDSAADVEALSRVLAELENIERVQLNTVVRPPAEKHVGALTRQRLEEIARQLPGRVEVIASFLGEETQGHKKTDVTAEEIFDLIERHPSTLEGVAEGLDVDVDAVRPLLDGLVASGEVATNLREGKTFFVAVNQG